jgi:Dyp-type peroxidase family
MTVIDRDDIQGNILNGYSRFWFVCYLLISVPDTRSARRLLGAVVDDVTTAAFWQAAAHPFTALNVAITYSGFEKLGLSAATLRRFPDAFRQTTRERAKWIGDVGASAPENWEEHIGTGEVHLMVTVHGRTYSDREAEQRRVTTLVEQCGGEVIRAQEAQLLEGMREHFGYADGAAQPDIEGAGRPPGYGSADGGGVPLPDGRWRPIKLGEFLLGYPDEDGDVATEPDPALVHNGSYVVYRKLQQNVARFQEGLTEAAKALEINPELLAAKVVGRWRDGTPLQLAPPRNVGDLSRTAIVPPPNDFRYLDDDREGFTCPVGAHIRRANPRDAMDFDGTLKRSGGGRMSARHRIIRRGVPYGSELDPNDTDDKGDRGLIFVCYNADIVRQFELVQAHWCDDVGAHGENEERDYVLGIASGTGKLTVPMRDSYPRFVPVLQDVVVTRGAEYIFAPGINALHGLANGRFC